MAIKLDYGINGLWYGEIFGFGLNLTGYSYLVLTSDWNEIANKC